jgi:hypothetical protein
MRLVAAIIFIGLPTASGRAQIPKYRKFLARRASFVRCNWTSISQDSDLTAVDQRRPVG